jgi:two-component system nitrate/nitrite response regulator NarL
MPTMNGLDACEVIKSTVGSKIIVVTVSEDPASAVEAFQRGALGYVLKKNAATELAEAIQTVALGCPYISPSIHTNAIDVTSATAGSYRKEEGLSKQEREIP